MNEALRQKKALYIPLFVAGKITNKQCAALVGISTVSVSRIKKRYLLKGDGAFIHGHTGKPSHNTKFTTKEKKEIALFYKKFYSPYEIFFETVRAELKKDISYTCVYNILNNAGYMSPKAHKPTKANGTFIYHGEKFRVNLPFKKFTLCISETLGVKAYYNGRYYDVELAEPLQDTISDSMPIV